MRSLSVDTAGDWLVCSEHQLFSVKKDQKRLAEFSGPWKFNRCAILYV